MSIAFTRSGDWIIVRPEFQRLDGATAHEFTQQVVEHCSGHPNLIIDLENVAFIDSRGLSALIAVLRGLPSEAKLRLAHVSEQVEILLSLTRINTLLQTYDSVEAALNT